MKSVTFVSRSLSCLIGLAACLLAPSVGAQSYYSVLDGAQQGTASPATGSATVTVDTAGNLLSYNLSFSGLLGVQTGGHIHGPADPGQGGMILHGLANGSPVVGVWNYPEVFEADILAGRTYFNIHTMGFGQGEIRGQIVPVPVSFCFCGVGLGPCGNDDPNGGCINSTGAGAKLTFEGLPSVILDTFTLIASPVPQNFGMYLMGQNEIAPLPFVDGIRCIGTTFFRFPIHQSAGGALTEGPGLVSTSLNFSNPLGHIMSGTTYLFQAWFRDPNGGPCGQTANASNALAVTFTP